MLLSILIPTYNSETTIKKCVESALNQDYNEEYEIIVANNASTDSTAEILSSIADSRLRIITNPQTISLWENHKILLTQAQSDYIVFLHSDDELLPDALKILSNCIKKRLNPKRYILWGESMVNDVSDWWEGIHSMLTYNTMISGVLAKRLMLMGKSPQPTGTCYSREALLNIDAIWPDTCSDWGITAWAAFNYFEFEMTDRLLFKREFSSSWDKMSKQERNMAISQQQEAFWNKCVVANKDKELKTMYWEFDISFWDTFFFNRGNRSEKLAICKRQIQRNPLRIKKYIKYLFVYLGLK